MRCYLQENTESVLKRLSYQQKYQGKSRGKTMHHNGPDEAEETETVRTQMQNGSSATGEDGDVGND